MWKSYNLDYQKPGNQSKFILTQWSFHSGSGEEKLGRNLKQTLTLDGVNLLWPVGVKKENAKKKKWEEIQKKTRDRCSPSGSQACIFPWFSDAI